LDGLLKNYGRSPVLAAQYYAAYHQAVQQQLGDQAGPILNWFTKAEIAANCKEQTPVLIPRVRSIVK